MATETIIKKTTVSNGQNGSGQVVELTDYTTDCQVTVYLDGRVLGKNEYELFYSSGYNAYVVYLQEALQGVEIGSMIEIHIVSGDIEGGSNDTEVESEDLQIYVPTNYSDVADIPLDLKKMAESIKKIMIKLDKKVPSWAKEPEKPTYTAEEVGALPDSTELFSGDYEDLDNKPDLSDFITNETNDLRNYYKKSESYTRQEVNDIVNGISTLNILVVESLPDSDISTSTIYLLAKGKEEESNVYDEYIYVCDRWEKLGDTKVDLSNYVSKQEVNGLVGECMNGYLGEIEAIVDDINGSVVPILDEINGVEV